MNGDGGGRNVRIGTAGWSIPNAFADRFPSAAPGGDDTHLARYSRRLNAVEINSTFYRSHRPETYARWADSVPDGFRFAVKIPREITHFRRLRDADEPLTAFLAETAALGAKRGPLLLQLPPRLAFDAPVATAFLELLRGRWYGGLVCEPRHATWFGDEAEALFVRFSVGRVAADPPVPVPEAAEPGGSDGIAYFRLHGSPRTYYSDYEPERLREIAARIERSAAPEIWCIFDNTALGCAAGNALEVTQSFSGSGEGNAAALPNP